MLKDNLRDGKHAHSQKVLSTKEEGKASTDMERAETI